MYKTRPSSQSKKISNNIIKNYPKKALQLIATNNKKKQNIINNYIPYSLIK